MNVNFKETATRFMKIYAFNYRSVFNIYTDDYGTMVADYHIKQGKWSKTLIVSDIPTHTACSP